MNWYGIFTSEYDCGTDTWGATTFDTWESHETKIPDTLWYISTACTARTTVFQEETESQPAAPITIPAKPTLPEPYDCCPVNWYSIHTSTWDCDTSMWILSINYIFVAENDPPSIWTYETCCEAIIHVFQVTQIEPPTVLINNPPANELAEPEECCNDWYAQFTAEWDCDNDVWHDLLFVAWVKNGNTIEWIPTQGCLAMTQTYQTTQCEEPIFEPTYPSLPTRLPKPEDCTCPCECCDLFDISTVTYDNDVVTITLNIDCSNIDDCIGATDNIWLIDALDNRYALVVDSIAGSVIECIDPDFLFETEFIALQIFGCGGPGTVTVIKHVHNFYQGHNVAADFELHIKHGLVDVTGSPFDGSEAGTSFILNADDYVLSEHLLPGYHYIISGDADILGNFTIEENVDKTITITNYDDYISSCTDCCDQYDVLSIDYGSNVVTVIFDAECIYIGTCFVPGVGFNLVNSLGGVQHLVVWNVDEDMNALICRIHGFDDSKTWLYAQRDGCYSSSGYSSSSVYSSSSCSGDTSDVMTITRTAEKTYQITIDNVELLCATARIKIFDVLNNDWYLDTWTTVVTGSHFHLLEDGVYYVYLRCNNGCEAKYLLIESGDMNDCYLKLKDFVLCNVYDPCNVECGAEAQERYEKAMKSIDKVNAFYHTLQSFEIIFNEDNDHWFVDTEDEDIVEKIILSFSVVKDTLDRCGCNNDDILKCN